MDFLRPSQKKRVTLMNISAKAKQKASNLTMCVCFALAYQREHVHRFVYKARTNYRSFYNLVATHLIHIAPKCKSFFFPNIQNCEL